LFAIGGIGVDAWNKLFLGEASIILNLKPNSLCVDPTNSIAKSFGIKTDIIYVCEL
jgi:hypothetical protein